MEILSIAPGMALMPQATSPPSKAGPAEQEQEAIHSLPPRTISPLVPTSISSEIPSRSRMPLEMTSATMSPPT